MSITRALVACGLSLFYMADAWADGVFGITTDVSGSHTTTSYSSVEAALDALKNSNFSGINPAYTGIQAAQVGIDYRGVSITTTYPTFASPVLVLNIPSLGITQTFNGSDRDASQALLKEYFKQNIDDILGKLSKSLARDSPIDPIAGNPNSLMSQLVMQDFNNGLTDIGGGQSGNTAGAGLAYGQYRQSGIGSRSYTVPLSYTFRNDIDPRRQLSFTLPISMTDAEGSRSYHVGLGGSYRFPINDNWTLMPAANYAVSGSLDLGSLAGVTSASVMSIYVLSFRDLGVVIGNMVGYYKAVRVKSGNYGYDPGIANTVLRNGLMLSQPITLEERAMSIEYSLIDTHFFGDDLYVNHFDEIGISLGSNPRARSARAFLRGGASLLISPKSKGFNLNLGYWF